MTLITDEDINIYIYFFVSKSNVLFSIYVNIYESKSLINLNFFSLLFENLKNNFLTSQNTRFLFFFFNCIGLSSNFKK